MAYYDEIRDVMTRRAGNWLARHAQPRISMTILMGIASLAAYRCTISLEAIGIRYLTVQFSISFLVGYVTFVVCVACWSRIIPNLEKQQLLAEPAALGETRSPHDWGEKAWYVAMTRSTARSAGQQQGSGGGIAILLLVALLGVAFVAAHWIIYARWFLGQILVWGGRVPHREIRDIPRDAWIRAPIQQTIQPAGLLWIHYTILGIVLQFNFPQANSIVEVFRALPTHPPSVRNMARKPFAAACPTVPAPGHISITTGSIHISVATPPDRIPARPGRTIRNRGCLPVKRRWRLKFGSGETQDGFRRAGSGPCVKYLENCQPTWLPTKGAAII